MCLVPPLSQVIHLTPESSKISVLLSALDLNPDVGQKTLIVTNCAQEVDHVFKVKPRPQHRVAASQL